MFGIAEDVKELLVPKVKKYNLTMMFNGLVFEEETDDIEQAILKLKPEQLYTEVYVTVFHDDVIVAERKLNLIQGKNLFINEDFRKVFIINLMLG